MKSSTKLLEYITSHAYTLIAWSFLIFWCLICLVNIKEWHRPSYDFCLYYEVTRLTWPISRCRLTISPSCLFVQMSKLLKALPVKMASYWPFVGPRMGAHMPKSYLTAWRTICEYSWPLGLFGTWNENPHVVSVIKTCRSTYKHSWLLGLLWLQTEIQTS